jgi:hypothetical protein
MAKLDKPRIWTDKKPSDTIRPVGEKPVNKEDRLRSTDTRTTKQNILPGDGERGTRQDTGPGLSEGKRFPQERRPDRGR